MGFLTLLPFWAILLSLSTEHAVDATTVCSQAIHSVMVTCLQEVYPSLTYQVYDAMFLRQSPGPGSLRQIFQWLWLSHPLERVSENVLHYPEHPQCHLPIRLHPVPQVLYELGMEDCVASFPVAFTLLL